MGTARPSRWAFRAPDSAFNLALVRISVAAVVLLSPETYQGPAWAALDPSLRTPPEGLGWFVASGAIDPTAVKLARLALVAGAALALLGVRARAALVVVTMAGFYTFALAQLAGSVQHDMHLLWFTALLAASPCADALALGRPAGGGDAVGARYAWPIDVACLLLAAIYFFPGLWKVATSGIDWIATDNLRNQMYWKWHQLGGWTPWLRIDRSSALCRAGALGVVAFELSFPLLVLFRPARPVAAVGGLLFHLLSELFLKIPFFGLWGCYLVLVDGRRIAAWAGWARGATSPDPRPPGAAARLLGVSLLAAALVQGARGAVQAWPFGCYPTFQWTVGDTIPDVEIEAVALDGRRAVVPPRGRSSAEWALTWRIAGAYGAPPTPAALAAYWALVRQDGRVAAAVGQATRVRFHAVARSVLPDDRGRIVRRGRLLGELTLRR